MAFGIQRDELASWKVKVTNGEIAFLTHYWIHPRFDNITTVTKAGCSDLKRLISWGEQYGLKQEWIHARDKYPHFDLIGEMQRDILIAEGLVDHLERFQI